MFFCTVILTELSMFCVRLSHFIIKFDWLIDWSIYSCLLLSIPKEFNRDTAHSYCILHSDHRKITRETSCIEQSSSIHHRLLLTLFENITKPVYFQYYFRARNSTPLTLYNLYKVPSQYLVTTYDALNLSQLMYMPKNRNTVFVIGHLGYTICSSTVPSYNTR